MRVLLSTYGSRGDVEPVVGLAVRLRALGAQVRVCAPPDEDLAELLAGVGVPLLPGQPFPPEVTGNRVLWDPNAQSFNVGFGSMRCVSEDIAGVAIEAIRAQGRERHQRPRGPRGIIEPGKGAAIGHGPSWSEAPLPRVPRGGSTRGGR